MSDLSSLIAEDAAPSTDKLEIVKTKARELRDLTLESEELMRQQELIAGRINTIQGRELPDLMIETGLNKLGLEAEGNLPAYDVEVKNFYSASIRADAPTAPAAYQWLDKNGHGDLIKHTFTISFGKNEAKAAKQFEKQLETAKVDYSSKLGVHSGTLTAFVKDQIENEDAVLPLDLLGATVGKWAKIQPRKEKTTKAKAGHAPTF